jgi:hypothetical protein
VRIKRSYWITGAILLVAFVVGILNENKLTVEDLPLFSGKNVYETNIIESWKTFKEEHELSNDARMEEFSMTLNNLGNFESVKFKLVEQQGDKFEVIHYQGCATCPNLQENELTVWKEKAIEIPNYKRFMNAEDFFTKLQAVNLQKTFTHETLHTLFLVRSQPWSDEITLPGKYYTLSDNQLIQIEGANEQHPLQGYNLQILENTGINFMSNEKTINIIIGDLEE